jgi:hypothetical protein
MVYVPLSTPDTVGAESEQSDEKDGCMRRLKAEPSEFKVAGQDARLVYAPFIDGAWWTGVIAAILGGFFLAIIAFADKERLSDPLWQIGLGVATNAFVSGAILYSIAALGGRRRNIVR